MLYGRYVCYIKKMLMPQAKPAAKYGVFTCLNRAIRKPLLAWHLQIGAMQIANPTRNGLHFAAVRMASKKRIKHKNECVWSFRESNSTAYYL